MKTLAGVAVSLPSASITFACLVFSGGARRYKSKDCSHHPGYSFLFSSGVGTLSLSSMVIQLTPTSSPEAILPYLSGW